MKLAITLGGTDAGRSGLGTWMKQVLPRLVQQLHAEGDQLLALGTARDQEAYRAELEGAENVVLPGWLENAGANAAWHFARAGARAREEGAHVLLLPAANRRVCALSPLPALAVVHDLAQLHVERKYDAARVAWFAHATLGALSRARRVVAVSEATARDLRAAVPVCAERLRVVHNGVDSARFAQGAHQEAGVRSMREALGLAGRYVLYTSRLEHPGKNHLCVLEAFAQSPLPTTHTLVLAGPDWGAQAMLTERARALGLEGHVRFTGRVDDGTLTALTVGADAAVQAGLHEGFGLGALEALAAGVPVAVADAGALPEVAGPLGVQFSARDPFSLAQALVRVTREAPLRARVRTEGPAWAARFDWSATASALVGLAREEAA